MPLVAIDLLVGRPDAELDAICDAVHQALTETLGVLEHDRFQIVTEHSPRTLRFDRDYLRGGRSDAFVSVRVTLAAGREQAAKRAFYARTAQSLTERAGVPTADVAIVLIEDQREDWSFGHGEASYLDIPRDEWR